MRKFLLMIFLGTIFGCATSVRIENLAFATEIKKFSQNLRNEISDVVTIDLSEKDDIPFDSEKFTKALILSLNHQHIFSKEGNYQLQANVLSIKKPFAFVNYEVTTSIRYILKNINTNSIVFDEIITTKYTATFEDAFFDIERLVLAKEGSIKINIEAFIIKLSKSEINKNGVFIVNNYIDSNIDNNELSELGNSQKVSFSPSTAPTSPNNYPPYLNKTIDIRNNIPITRKKNKNAIGVIIGNHRYSNKDVPSVDFALNDANYMKKYLVNTLGYDEGNIIYIENATQTDFITVFGNEQSHKGKLYDWVKENKSDVFVYYAGHGAPNPENKNGYFVPTNADPTRLDLTGYNLNLFYKNLSQIKYKSLTVVLDACFSGVSEKGMLLKNVSPIMPKVKTDYVLKKNTCIFTSASEVEVSSWYPEKQHSLFTYFFLKGLQGEADANKDKIISSKELKKYLDENVVYFARRISSREQHPQLVENNPINIANIR